MCHSSCTCIYIWNTLYLLFLFTHDPNSTKYSYEYIPIQLYLVELGTLYQVYSLMLSVEVPLVILMLKT